MTSSYSQSFCPQFSVCVLNKHQGPQHCLRNPAGGSGRALGPTHSSLLTRATVLSFIRCRGFGDKIILISEPSRWVSKLTWKLLMDIYELSWGHSLSFIITNNQHLNAFNPYLFLLGNLNRLPMPDMLPYINEFHKYIRSQDNWNLSVACAYPNCQSLNKCHPILPL